MALINRAGQEISAKVVYYGPGLSGKTTNLEVLFRQVPEDNRGKMISMKTRTDRTLFFDLLPLSGDSILDFSVRILLYTVPGQVYYNATRRLVLKGVDAVVFVADSQRGKMEENLESLENLRSNLVDMGLKLEDLPWVIQYNKRDLPDILSVEELDQALNPAGVPSFTAVAPRGEGVQETLRGVTEHLRPHLQHMVEKELGDTLRSGQSTMQSTPPPSVQQSTPPAAPVPPPAPAGPDSGERHTLDLGGLPDPRVVEMSRGDQPKAVAPAGGGIADLMDGRDMRRALREVETSVESSPLRTLSETPAAPSPPAPPAPPESGGGPSPLERMTASTPATEAPSQVVPEIVEIQERPTAPAPTPPVSASAPEATTPEPSPSVAPPPAPPAMPSTAHPTASDESAAQVLTLRVPRALLIRGEITLRLVLDDSPAASGGGQASAAPSAASPAAPAAPSAPTPTAAPVASAQTSPPAPPPEPAPAPQPAPAPEPRPAAVPAQARSSAPMAGRPAGTGTRFALRDGELVPLD